MSVESDETTEAALRTLLQTVRVPGATLGLDDDLPAVGLTSLATVDLMLAIEDRFGLEFPERMLNRRTFATLASLVAAVEELRGG